MAIPTGTQIDHYEVLSLLGAGGMGEVYLAHDLKLGRKVALKILPAQFTADADRVRRFEQEARAASALNHPNLVTIFDIGKVDNTHFMAAEYVDGEALRDRLHKERLTLNDALDIAIQLAGALAVAHGTGIVHRDIKPENVMLRRDGIVKVLDFGLAKLIEQGTPGADSGAADAGWLKTAPGTVMGTPYYMAPEQARARRVDGRTDIFSLGVVLYEMIAGQRPFRGNSVNDVIAALLREQPTPLTATTPGTPPELDRIINHALAKDPAERYQTAGELLAELKELKAELEFAAKLERSAPPDRRLSVSAPISEASPASNRQTLVLERPFAETAAPNNQTTAGGATVTAPANAEPTAVIHQATVTSQQPNPADSAQFRIPQSAIRIGVALTLLVLAGIAAFFYFNRGKSVLTDKDTILLAEFDNKTGDTVFDGTLRQGLAVQLRQSPFLNLFPDARIRQTLQMMRRSDDERVTREVGREIAIRQGVKALVAGTIASLGRNYSVTLEALNSQTGETIGLTQAEAEGKEQVLKALSRAATELREKLGESLASIRKFDAPLEEATTSSLDALKAYSLGYEQTVKGRFREAIPFYNRAVESDQHFASAWLGLAASYYITNQPVLAAEQAAKAFALRDRASEIEKFRISLIYYSAVTGEMNRNIEVWEMYKRTSPNDPLAAGIMSDCYIAMGQYQKAIEEAETALRLAPNTALWYATLSNALIRLDRFAEAGKVFERAAQQKLDQTFFHTGRYQLAFVSGQAVAMQQQLDWAREQPDEYVAFEWRSGTAAYAGQWMQAQDFARRAIDFAARSDVKGVAAQYAAEAAIRGAVFGQCAQAKATLAQALALERNQVSLSRAALVLALCGEASRAQELVDELLKQYPKDTVINGLWLPTIKAALELSRGNAGAAIEQLQPAMRYEAAGEFCPQYVRGQAYLKLNKSAEAAAEFQKILDHRGQAPLSVLYPLARLGVARAAAMSGDVAKARKAYGDFFTLWKDADADLPILIEAKKEFSKTS